MPGPAPETRDFLGVDMDKRALLLMIVVVIFSCGPQVMFAVDLKDIAYQEGDLPVEEGALSVQEVDAAKDWQYDSWAEVKLAGGDGELLLLVDVVLFTDKKELQRGYEEFLAGERHIEEGLADYIPPDVGYALLAKKQPRADGGSEVYLTFQRCYALVNIWARIDPVPVFAEKNLYQYAKGLDARLNHSVCPI
jgi:hypothetical protein